MKIEYLPGHRPPLPLVRLFDFRPAEVNALRDACDGLADGRLTEFRIHEQPWALPVNGCRFIWRPSQHDVGVHVPRPGQPLVLECSGEAWREVAGKLSQFTEACPDEFNWLTVDGEVNVLISATGTW